MSDLNGRCHNKVIPESGFVEKGQKILYEGEEAEVIKVTPVLVLKTKTRVVCGDLTALLLTTPHPSGDKRR